MRDFDSAPVAQLDRVSGYEPEGRAFESLRARQLDMKLGTFSKEVPIFIFETASLRAAVLPVTVPVSVPTRISPPALRDALQPRLVSGELHLPEAGGDAGGVTRRRSEQPAMACSGPVAVDGLIRVIFAT
jgi:hypothetical protein